MRTPTPRRTPNQTPTPTPTAPPVTWIEGSVGTPADPEGEPGAETTGDSQPDSAGDDSARGRGGAGGAMAALANRNRGKAEGEYVTEVEEALDTADQLVILFIYSASDDRKYRRATESSQKFEEAVLGDFNVATRLQGCKTIRFDGTQMTREIRKAYKLSSSIPQLVLIDVTGKVLFKATASTNADTLAKMIKAAKERCAELVADRDGS